MLVQGRLLMPRMEDLAGILKVVIVEADNAILEGSGSEHVNEHLDLLLKEGSLVEDHVKSFLGNGNKSKAEQFRDCNGGNTNIRFFR